MIFRADFSKRKPLWKRDNSPLGEWTMANLLVCTNTNSLVFLGTHATFKSFLHLDMAIWIHGNRYESKTYLLSALVTTAASICRTHFCVFVYLWSCVFCQKLGGLVHKSGNSHAMSHKSKSQLRYTGCAFDPEILKSRIATSFCLGLVNWLHSGSSWLLSAVTAKLTSVSIQVFCYPWVSHINQSFGTLCSWFPRG